MFNTDLALSRELCRHGCPQPGQGSWVPVPGWEVLGRHCRAHCLHSPVLGLLCASPGRGSVHKYRFLEERDKSEMNSWHSRDVILL